MINVRSLTKRYGSTVAVDGLSFEVRRGQVTGFLGPNGAGKSTTMRMILGLDRPSEGTALIDGTPYGELRNPLRKVGALLDAKAVHGGRRACDHLLCLAQSNGIPASRVTEVLALTGLTAVARRRVGGFSLGMSQRLGIAAALLGDPEILMFDEPVNGLDPEGIMWIRTLMRDLAAEGRAVFVSSHLMSEMAQTADHLVVIGRGRLIADTGVEEFIGRSSQAYVRVRAPRLPELARVLGGTGGTAGPVEVALHGDHLRVTGLGAEAVGETAAGAGLTLHELTPVSPSLEAAYMELTQESTEYAGARA
ncbi:ABC transporter ATP-binding protein [Planomonospora sp. ID82291]|uniref:ABC transporter ATP-binding protein n=1 Tax=Planomonospora sp. ID82291 TaxID=2738136 RepID=UPI0018C372FC|nr:ATP-binding cassette domain-containing protein [Planomonospora sp. ID82291]MBG0813984.1 ATP-binding cassette domain-containing protein [Planomonospora sp. ID82291]